VKELAFAFADVHGARLCVLALWDHVFRFAVT